MNQELKDSADRIKSMSNVDEKTLRGNVIGMSTSGHIQTGVTYKSQRKVISGAAYNK